MKGKIKHITIALGICLLLAMIVLGLKNRNTIYTWFLGDVQTLYMQADSLYRQKRYEEAATLYSKLAKIDTAKRCQFILGDIYYQGKTGVRNYKKAMKLFLESADNGNADSQNNLGYMYAYSIGTDIDYSKAKKYLSLAALQGHSQAQVGLGSLYRHDWGVTKSYSEAFKLYKKAAAHDNTDAMNNLGYMYTFGYGTSTSAGDAIYWFEKSASRDNVSALFNLAVFHIEGHGYPKDLSKGAELLSRAAELNSPAAQFNLGLMYYFGKGVEKDYAKAKHLFQQASAQGHNHALEFLMKVENKEKVSETDSIFDWKLKAI
jgi:TPR repeat protein